MGTRFGGRTYILRSCSVFFRIRISTHVDAYRVRLNGERMPSESAKKRQAQKKAAAAKKRQPQGPKTVKANGDLSEDATPMVERAPSERAPSEGAGASVNGDKVTERVEELKLSARSCTGTFQSSC